MYSILHNNNIGSVISGTLQEQDLIPAFIRCLDNQAKLKPEHTALIREIRTRIQETINYYNTDDSEYDLADLFDALSEYAMPYMYFGAHIGDGADFGFWLIDDFEHDFDGLKVSDLSEIPTRYTGEVLNINDHGNMTLYQCINGRLFEIWGMV